jgi:hypothetical protein
MSITPQDLQKLLDEREASRASRRRAWENLQEIRWIFKEAATPWSTHVDGSKNYQVSTEVNYFPTSNVPTPVVQSKIIVYQSDGTTHADSQVGGVVVPSITGNRWTPDALIVSGTLTNTSAVAVKITGIDAKGFNESQKMVIGGSDFTIVHNDLAPGETVNFKVALKDTTKQVKFVKVTPSWLP